MSRLELAVAQIVAARDYTLWLLDSVPADEWFWSPSGTATHVAWQVGHLAMAQFSLTLLRMRGERHEDDRLISSDFLAAFGRDSSPRLDSASYPPVDEIRATFDRVHRQALIELVDIPDDVLDEPLARPHRICKTKNDALWWCSRHEMLHAGQIGLLRRLAGHPPLW